MNSLKCLLLVMLLGVAACGNGETTPQDNDDAACSVEPGARGKDGAAPVGQAPPQDKGDGAPAKDAEAGWDRIALYIGINQYRDASLRAKSLKGCVNDMHSLRAVLESQYDFPRSRSRMLDTYETTTRAKIKEALLWLMAQAKTAKSNGVEPTIVLAYAGHGGWIKAKDTTMEGADQKDETWVPSDGNSRGGMDIRDDDIARVVQNLCDPINGHGATVVRLNDSCHSGTGYRGDEEARTRSARDLSDLIGGPKPRDLFPGPGYKDFDPDNVRLAYFAACQDEQKAKESKDENNRICGRYTYSLVRALKEARGATYAALARETSRIMDATWDGESQTPNFRAFGDLDNKTTFGVAPLPAHVGFVKGSKSGRFVHIDAGSLQGVNVGQRFDLYESLGHLRKDEKLVRGGVEMFGIVRTVYEGTSKIAVERSDFPANAIARFGDISLPDFKIHVLGDMPKKVQAELDALFDKKTLLQADKGFALELRWNKSAKPSHLRFYWPDRLFEEGQKDDPFALEFFYEDPDARLGSTLTKLALRRRMLLMKRNERYLDLSVELDQAKPLGKALEPRGTTPRFATEPDDEDERRVHVRIKIKSTYKKKLWVFLFMFEEYESGESGQRLYVCEATHPRASTDEENFSLTAAVPLEIQKRMYPGPVAGAKGVSRVRLKLLATNVKYDASRFAHICEPLEAGSRNAAEDDPLVRLLENLGTSGQRGSDEHAVVSFWATRTATFDLVELGGK